MLPLRIKELVVSLREKTEADEYKWDYDDEATEVSLETKKNKITLAYKFDTVEEVGRFNIKYFNKKENKEYYFTTNELYEDYTIVRMLFDTAQSSDIEIDEDF